jgi:hypothetical protein
VQYCRYPDSTIHPALSDTSFPEVSLPTEGIPHIFLISTLHADVWATSRLQLPVQTVVTPRDGLNSVEKSEISAALGNRTQFFGNPFRSLVTVLSRLVRVPQSVWAMSLGI